jgi:hypothetical protein
MRIAARVIAALAGLAVAPSAAGAGAGETLVERVGPESFDRMVRLYNSYGERPSEQCEAAAITTRTAAEPNGAPSHRK